MGTQTGILAEVPKHVRHLFFSLTRDAEVGILLAELNSFVDGDQVVAGIGQPFIDFTGSSVPGSITAPVYSGSGVGIAALPYALWLWLRGDDPGELTRLALAIEQRLAQHCNLEDMINGFLYDTGRDLTGYVDGTENPEGEEAVSAAVVAPDIGKTAGSSFVAIQKWQHDLDRFRSWSREEQDLTIGRRLSDNEEIDDAPASAHVKRTAQETFDPEAFILRRSMPYSDLIGDGLVFVAFGHSFTAFDTLMKQMLGLNDGITDSLFNFSVPLGTSFFWCPPMKDDELDLSLLLHR